MWNRCFMKHWLRPSFLLTASWLGWIAWGDTAEDLGAPRLGVRSGDRSVVLRWDERITAGRRAGLWRAAGDTTTATEIVSGRKLRNGYADLAVTNGVTYRYELRVGGTGAEPERVLTARATPRPFASDDEFLELLQATAFDYFWNEANPANGLVRDRSTPESFCSIAAVGFGLSAIAIGIDHGWITREEGRERVRRTLETFLDAPQGEAEEGTIGHRGWFYHFLDMRTARRFNAQIELSSIDTALWLAGVLDVREYFDGAEAAERVIRDRADALVRRVDWNWMRDGGETLTMGWLPGKGFLKSRWRGYNEASLLYLMGLGVSQHPLPATAWRAWTSSYRWETHHGQSFVVFPPLFGHQYTQVWFDLRGVADDVMRSHGLDYFENSRRATLAQRAYAVANPGGFRDYGENEWGLTASDGPRGYGARGAPPAENDDGTIAPTAAGGSFAFTPRESLAALRSMYERHRARLWSPYGFRDAFNRQRDWWATDVLGIDQGPILLAIENQRTGRVWARMRRSEVIARGMERAGFRRIVSPAAVPAGLTR